MTPAYKHPATPPLPTLMYIKLIKSYDPKVASFLDYITIMASETTLVNASDNEVIINRRATLRGSSGSHIKSVIKATN